MPYTAKSFAARHNKKLAGTPAASQAAAQATAMESMGVDPGIAIATANKNANRLNRRMSRLKKRGIVSNDAGAKAVERYGGNDQQPIDASAR